jgi:RND family efflux transporter MFP subunit
MLLNVWWRAAPVSAVVCAAVVLSACGPAETEAPAPAPWVKTVALSPAADAASSLSGTVRARVESPLAFQVGGRIAQRHVDAGQNVSAGQVLFELDKRDLDAGLQAAQADAAAAETALAIAESELKRSEQLQQQNFISGQALDRAQLARREALTRRDAAAARLRQSGNTQGYGSLRAPAGGVLMEVNAQAGQVVAAGQTVAVLAQQGAREIEVFFPENTPPAPTGRVWLPSGPVALRLREAAGAVDPLGRTRRARYTVQAPAESLVLGALVRTEFTAHAAAAALAAGFVVPIGALDERAQGPRIWVVEAGVAQAKAVQVIGMDAEQARTQVDLPANSRVVALGTHLLQDGMAVREIAP